MASRFTRVRPLAPVAIAAAVTPAASAAAVPRPALSLMSSQSSAKQPSLPDSDAPIPPHFRPIGRYIALRRAFLRARTEAEAATVAGIRAALAAAIVDALPASLRDDASPEAIDAAVPALSLRPVDEASPARRRFGLRSVVVVAPVAVGGGGRLVVGAQPTRELFWRRRRWAPQSPDSVGAGAVVDVGATPRAEASNPPPGV